MNYDQDQMLRLMEAVEEQGGHQAEDADGLPLRCRSRRYAWTGDRIKPQTFPGCGNETLFEVCYDALDIAGGELGPQPVRVCAVDDAVGAWPRFAHAMKDPT